MTTPASDSRQWTLKALSPIWTGDANRQGDQLIPTGLLGSIRWWFEVLVRGLDGQACDPSEAGNRCPDEKGRHCVVCELFGCTGWARKFRFQVLDKDYQVLRSAIKADETFHLRLIPVRPIRDEEWQLLEITFRLIAEFAAIGGKTVLKPSDEANRQVEPHHRDYGLIQIDQAPTLEQRLSNAQLRAATRESRWRTLDQGDFAWASLKNFWCVRGRHLSRESTTRSTFNRFVGRDESKACRDCQQVHSPTQKCSKTGKHPKRFSERLANNSAVEKWLAGSQQESKKVFSFKNPPLTFGFVNPDIIDFVEMKRRLREVWPDLKDDDFVPGDEVLRRLLKS